MSIQYGGDKITFQDGSTVGSGWSGFKNRIINGAMVIDQRNAGASVTPANAQYTLDRWTFTLLQASKITTQQSTVAPSGFVNSLLVTSSSAYSVLSSDTFAVQQRVEGFNVADLGWGTASAQPVTLSFWVRSSLTGTFGGSIANGAFNRSYPFSYTISAANTWEQKSVTIAGDTTGTWTTSNGTGMVLYFNLGSGSTYSGTANTWAGSLFIAPTGATSVVGTNGATFYITGVQLEKGSTATSFDYRPYGTELALCQRYYWKLKNTTGTIEVIGVSTSYTTNDTRTVLQYPVTMRALPSSSISSGASYFKVEQNLANIGITTLNTAYTSATSSLLYGVSTGTTGGQGGVLYTNDVGAFISFSAEL